MPRMEFSNMEKLAMIQGALVRDKSDPDDTVMLQATHKDLAVMMGGILVLDMIFPEYADITEALSKKINEVTKATDFFASRYPDSFCKTCGGMDFLHAEGCPNANDVSDPGEPGIEQ